MGRISAKAESFTESVIREMNRLAMEAGAVSLAQGFPDFAAPLELKEAAAAALFVIGLAAYTNRHRRPGGPAPRQTRRGRR